MIGTGLSRHDQKLFEPSNSTALALKRLEDLESDKLDENVIEVSNESPRSNSPVQIQMEFSGEISDCKDFLFRLPLIDFMLTYRYFLTSA